MSFFQFLNAIYVYIFFFTLQNQNHHGKLDREVDPELILMMILKEMDRHLHETFHQLQGNNKRNESKRRNPRLFTPMLNYQDC